MVINPKNSDLSNKLLFAGANSSSTPEYIRDLLINGANINALDGMGNTPLHRFVSFSRFELIEVLIKAGANAAIQNKRNNTALDIAIEIGNVSIIHILSIATKYFLSTSLDKFLLFSTRIGDFEQVKRAIEDGADINTCNVNGVTALHMSSIAGYVKITDYLTDPQRRANLDAEDMNHGTPLHYAVMNDSQNHREAINILIKKGANYSISPDGDFSFFHKAAHRGYDEIITVILKNITDINENSNPSGATALHAAAMMGQLKVVYLLLNAGADVSIKNIDGQSAYYLARANSFHQVAAILNSDKVKLISAVANGKIGLVKSLLAKGVDINSVGYYGESALEMATKKGNLELVEFLLSEGALIKIDMFGDSILHIAAKNHQCKIREILVEKGANFTATNWLNKTALDYAPECKYIELQMLGSELLEKVFLY